MGCFYNDVNLGELTLFMAECEGLRDDVQSFRVLMSGLFESKIYKEQTSELIIVHHKITILLPHNLSSLSKNNTINTITNKQIHPFLYRLYSITRLLSRSHPMLVRFVAGVYRTGATVW